MSGYSQKILVTDDTPANISLIHGILGALYEVLFATNGEEALETAILEKPDLILMDVMMPVMDGFEACRRLKADARTQDIPIIFLTALADSDAILRGFEAGGVDYICKPFQERELVARVHTHLSLKQALDTEKALREKLQVALASVRQLSGLLPICANCKNIRDDKGYWNQLENYISSHSDTVFTHGICPNCAKTLYGIDLVNDSAKTPSSEPS